MAFLGKEPILFKIILGGIILEQVSIFSCSDCQIVHYHDIHQKLARFQSIQEKYKVSVFSVLDTESNTK